MQWDINPGKSSKRPGPQRGFGLTGAREGGTYFGSWPGCFWRAWFWDYLWFVHGLFGVYQRGLFTEGKWLMQVMAEWQCTTVSLTRMQRITAALLQHAAAKRLNSCLVLCSLPPSQSWHSLDFWTMLTSLQPLRLAKVILLFLPQTEPQPEALLLKLLLNHTSSRSASNTHQSMVLFRHDHWSCSHIKRVAINQLFWS